MPQTLGVVTGKDGRPQAETAEAAMAIARTAGSLEVSPTQTLTSDPCQTVPSVHVSTSTAQAHIRRVMMDTSVSIGAKELTRFDIGMASAVVTPKSSPSMKSVMKDIGALLAIAIGPEKSSTEWLWPWVQSIRSTRGHSRLAIALGPILRALGRDGCAL